MPHGLLPIAAADAAPDLSEPQAVVEAFLAALMASDLDAALDLVDEDLVYVNVGLPTIRGRAGLAKAFQADERIAEEMAPREVAEQLGSLATSMADAPTA